MCIFFSCILTRDGKVYSLLGSDNHDEIIKIHQLKDDKLKNRDLVRISINPNNGKNPGPDRSDWTLKEDEEETLPGWYDEDMMALREKCWKAWEKAFENSKKIPYHIQIQDYCDKCGGQFPKDVLYYQLGFGVNCKFCIDDGMNGWHRYAEEWV